VASSVRDFYDGLAAEYHLVYGDHWDDAVARQGEVLDALIRDVHGDTADVLDCSCGIGTQAIGVALRGHRVHGADISTWWPARRGGSSFASTTGTPPTAPTTPCGSSSSPRPTTDGSSRTTARATARCRAPS
jgi:hypothetical protein